MRTTTTLLTVDEVRNRLGVAKSTFARWKAIGTAPKLIKLPNGKLRVRESDLAAWLENLEGAA